MISPIFEVKIENEPTPSIYVCVCIYIYIYVCTLVIPKIIHLFISPLHLNPSPMAGPHQHPRSLAGLHVDAKSAPFFYGALGMSWVVPLPRMPVTTRIVMFLVGDPYKPSFATVTGRGDNPRHVLSHE